MRQHHIAFAPTTALLLAGLLSTVSAAPIAWTNTTGGNWNVAANWSPNQVPGATDNIFITNGGTYVVTLNVNAIVNTLMLGAESGSQILANSSATLTLTNIGTVGSNSVLAMSGGSLAGSGSLLVNGLFDWSGGTLSGVGTRTIGAGGALNIQGNATKTLVGGTLVNTAMAVWSAGTLSVGGGAVLSNAPGGIFDITFDGAFSDNFSSVSTLNAGLWRKTGGNGMATILDSFHNSGTVSVQSGTLRLAGGGTHSGSFTAADAAALDFGGGTHTINTGAIVSGSGTLTVSAGTVNFFGTVLATGPVALTGGIFSPSAGGGITLAALSVSGGTLAGTGEVTVSGAVMWTSGGFSGSGLTHLQNGLSVSGPGAKILGGRTLVNLGTATWSEGTINAGGTAVLSNAPGATFDIAADVSFFDDAGAITTYNAGLMRKTAGFGITTLHDTFHNSGNIEVQSGTLRFVDPSGGTHSGSFILSPGSTLECAGAAHSLASGASINGGRLVMNSGSLIVQSNAIVTVTNLVVNGGTIAGTGSLTASGLMTWTGGSLSGAGTVQANGGLVISGATTKSLNARTLVNNAQSIWSEGPIAIGFGCVISNAPGASFDLAGDVSYGDLTQVGTTMNAGLWRKIGGTGTSLLRDTFNNSGIVEIRTGSLTFPSVYTQTDGETLLLGGDITNNSPLRIHGGLLAGTNFISGSVSNRANVEVGTFPGPLRIGGSYFQTAAGTLTVELPAALPVTDSNQLIVAETASIAGTLRVTLTGNTELPGGTRFRIISAALRSGTFTSFVYDTNNLALLIQYLPNAVEIEVLKNRPPVLPILSDITVNELETLIITNAATDPDGPADELIYNLLEAPTGAAIGTNGIITWATTELDGPGVHSFTTVVTDQGLPPRRATNSFQAIVREINIAPIFPRPPNQTNNEFETVSFMLSATDPDTPTNRLTFELLFGPDGLAVSSNGLVTWVTGELDDGGRSVAVRVTDDGSPPLSTTNGFLVVIREVNNHPPVIVVPPPSTIDELTTILISVQATDPDRPFSAVSLAFPNPPQGFTQTPFRAYTADESFGPATALFTVVATDNGSPPLSTTNTFTLDVLDSVSRKLTVVNTNDNGPGSLRDAILTANTNVEVRPDFIAFNLPAGTPIILPGSPLPAVTRSVIMDASKTVVGFVFAGGFGAPVVELDGRNAGSNAHGLHLTASNVIVRSLAINRFSGSGVRIKGDSNRVELCFIGSGLTGTNRAGNGGHGVDVVGAFNDIGGAQRNWINVIGDNLGYGIRLQAANNNRMRGNRIGIGLGQCAFPDHTGAQLDNRLGGIGIEDDSRGNIIGDIDPVDANQIAHHRTNSVRVVSGRNNTIRGNLMSSRFGIPVDMGVVGVTTNDPGDLDGIQNFPIIETVGATETNTLFSIVLTSRLAQAVYTIDLYHDQFCQTPNIFGGSLIRDYVASTQLTTGLNGVGRLSFILPGSWRARKFSLTATDADGNTSEFGPAFDVFDLSVTPELAVERSNDVVTVSWQQTSSFDTRDEYRLETAFDTQTPIVWRPVAEPVFSVSSRLAVRFTNSPPTGNQFFRLVFP